MTEHTMDLSEPSSALGHRILGEYAERIGTITLNYPEKRNILSEDLIGELIQELNHFAREGVGAVILRARLSAGVWSAGHDVNELPLGGHDPLGWRDPLRALVRELESYPAPIIALIDGSVWGGACEAVFACDLVVATPEATFAATPARHGVPYNVTGLLTFLNAAHMRIAKEMLFTAQPIAAPRLERLGVVNHVVPADEIEAFTHRMATQITANAPLSIAVMKEQLRILGGAHTMSPQDFERIQGLRRIVYSSDDYAEGIAAFKAKRRPRFQGK